MATRDDDAGTDKGSPCAKEGDAKQSGAPDSAKHFEEGGALSQEAKAVADQARALTPTVSPATCDYAECRVFRFTGHGSYVLERHKKHFG